ncbi:MAG: glutamate formimidoyltransferase [Firmicutes bacterium]|nr:glutamate formimidoyltransferase [Bacillota bacterium]
MTQYIHAVPNFSEGRRQEVIETIISQVRGVPGVKLIGYFPDPDFNRTVVELVGTPQPMVEALLNMAARAIELIDMEQQTGSHPRIGAQDTIPLFPMRNISLDECTQLAEEIGKKLNGQTRVPIFFAGENARIPERKALDFIRKGQYEGLRDLLLSGNCDPRRLPDIGDVKDFVHKGGTIVSAGSNPLVAVNYILNTDDVQIAKRIARAARGPSGGFSSVRAVGLRFTDRNQAVVSMNMFDHNATPLSRTFNLVKSEAERYGAAITATQLIGTVPQESLVQVAEYFLRLEGFDRTQIRENHLIDLHDAGVVEASKPAALTDMSVKRFVQELASNSPAPGGGSVAALSAAMSAGLLSMVLGLTLGREKFADVEGELYPLKEKTRALHTRLLELANIDTDTFNEVMATLKLPRETEEQKQERSARIQAAYKKAVGVPLEVAEKCVGLLEMCPVIAEKGNPSALSDAGVAANMAYAGLEGAAMNVRINLGSIKDEEFVRETRSRVNAALKVGRDLRDRVAAYVNQKIQVFCAVP